MTFTNGASKYADIINLPHPESRKHKRMSMRDRAAQFSPFAALAGHDEAIRETARLTDDFVDLDEVMKRTLNEKLVLILENLNAKPSVTITYFLKDLRKDGGSYEVAEGWIRKVDFYERVIVMGDHSRILLDCIVDIDSDAFSDFRYT